MPKTPIDYAKTIIYKLVHKDDLNDENVYIGHTTEMRIRKNHHKSVCNNSNKKEYNQKKYQYIRENGGWDEWLMIEIEKYPCKDKYEARARERVIQTEMKAKLNDKIECRTRKEYREDNKESIAIKKRIYYENNIEQKKEYDKQYRKDNFEKKKQQAKQYRQDNLQKIKDKYNEKIICECGCSSTYSNINRHRNTDKHKKKMEELNN